MTLFGRIPLAWHNLTHERRRLLLAAAGIGFAVLLMCMQIGFFFAMSDSTVEVLERLNADLVLKNSNRYTLLNREVLTRRRLFQAAAVEGVQGAYPLYLESSLGQWRSLTDGIPRTIRIIAFDLDDPVMDVPGLAEHRDQLRAPQTALSDLSSKRGYGPLGPETVSELSGRELRIAGQFVLGTDFANDGNLIMSDRNFGRYFPRRMPGLDTLNDVDLGIIQVAPGHDIAEVQRRLREVLPADVEVIPKRQLIDEERRFWQDSTPIGFIFGLGTFMGFLVGVTICYQILYADVDDHMAEFATLKAMGYGPRYFVGIILQEAILLSIFGFIPGLLVSAGMYWLLASWTGLLMRLTFARAAFIFLLTVIMCVASGTLAIRKLLKADPAELF